MGKTRRFSEDPEDDEARKPTFNRRSYARVAGKEFSDEVYSDKRAVVVRELSEIHDE